MEDRLSFVDLVDLDEGWYEDITERDAQAEDDSQVFTIRDDNMAEWAMRKVAETEESYARLIDCCETQARVYMEKAQAYAKKRDQETNYLKVKLESYFASVPHKSTKTQETYQLPSGRLVLRHHEPQVVRDDGELAAWCETNGLAAAVTYEPHVKWADLKKQLTPTDTGYITPDGEIVPGVKREQKPDTFELRMA